MEIQPPLTSKAAFRTYLEGLEQQFCRSGACPLQQFILDTTNPVTGYTPFVGEHSYGYYGKGTRVIKWPTPAWAAMFVYNIDRTPPDLPNVRGGWSGVSTQQALRVLRKRKRMPDRGE